MGNRIENGEQLKLEIARKYLFFDNRVLYLGNHRNESHKEILENSGRKIDENLIAGRFWFLGDKILIDGEGNDGLGIEGKDPLEVVNHVKSLLSLSNRTIEVEATS